MTNLESQRSYVTPLEFRHVVGHIPSGVTIITTALEDVRYGMTASSVTSLSADPALMVVCIHNSAPTAGAIVSSGTYAINVLGERHEHLARQFAVPSANKFSCVGTRSGVLGDPILEDAIASIECEVTETIAGGTHSMFVGRVVSCDAAIGQPLTYFRGGFGRFQFSSDDDVYRHARELILRRSYRAKEVIVPEEMAAKLDVDVAAAVYALTKLASEDLVRRDADAGYVVVPFDVRVAEEAFDARLVIELGVIERWTEPVDGEMVRALRSCLAEMSSCLDGDRFLDFDRYLEVNHAFHRALIATAQNSGLVAVFETLCTKSVMAKSFGATPESSQRFVTVQRSIVDAFEDCDHERAREAASEYCEIAKQRVRELIVRKGGSI